jgi:hypothetical protein
MMQRLFLLLVGHEGVEPNRSRLSILMQVIYSHPIGT